MRNFFILNFLLLNGLLSAQITAGFHFAGGAADNSQIFNRSDRQNWQADGVVAATAGAVVTVPLHHNWALQTELNADLRGSSRLALTNRFLYLSVPLLLRYQWARGQAFQPYVLSGLYGARLLGRRQIIDYTQPFPKIMLPEYGRPRRSDFGAVLAVGGECPLRHRWSLTAECRASWGLRELYPVEEELILRERTTNVSWLLDVGVRRRW